MKTTSKYKHCREEKLNIANLHWKPDNIVCTFIDMSNFT